MSNYRKSLIVICTGLFFVLIGLIVFYDFQKQSHEITDEYIYHLKDEYSLILKINHSSTSINNFFEVDHIKNDSLFSKIHDVWKLVDSITTRNYKTSEILKSATVFICFDSLKNYQVIIQSKTNFKPFYINQFLANISITKKINKDNEQKSIDLTNNRKLYFNVKGHHIFFTENKDIYSDFMKPIDSTRISNINVRSWLKSSNADISIYFNKSVTKLNHLPIHSLPVLYSSFTYGYIDIKNRADKLDFDGAIGLDSTLNYKIHNNLFKPIYFSEDENMTIQKSFTYIHEDNDSVRFLNQYQYIQWSDSSTSHYLVKIESNNLNLILKDISNDTSAHKIELVDSIFKNVIVLKKSNTFVSNELIHCLPNFVSNSIDPTYFVSVYNNGIYISLSTESLLLYSQKMKSTFTHKIETNEIIGYEVSRVGTLLYSFEYIHKDGLIYFKNK